MSKRYIVFWKNEIIGYIENLNAENFHWYGEWIPARTPSSNDFLAALEEGAEYLWVGVDENRPTHTVAGEGIYHINETEFIDVVWRSNPPETW